MEFLKARWCCSSMAKVENELIGKQILPVLSVDFYRETITVLVGVSPVICDRAEVEIV